jgi:hypothetical protein
VGVGVILEVEGRVEALVAVLTLIRLQVLQAYNTVYKNMSTN